MSDVFGNLRTKDPTTAGKVIQAALSGEIVYPDGEVRTDDLFERRPRAEAPRPESALGSRGSLPPLRDSWTTAAERLHVGYPNERVGVDIDRSVFPRACCLRCRSLAVAAIAEGRHMYLQRHLDAHTNAVTQAGRLARHRPSVSRRLDEWCYG